MKIFKKLPFLSIVLFLFSCDKGSEIVSIDLTAIWEADQQTITDYINENDLSPVVTTTSGASYIIQDFGTGDAINYNDILSLNYTGYDLNGVAFVSTINPPDSVYHIYAVYNPLTFTYTKSGWTLKYTPLVSTLSGDGMIEALTDALIEMKKDGQLTVLLPSQLGFGAQSDPSQIISRYSVLRYEISPVVIR